MKKWVKTIDLSLRWKEEWTDENVHEMGKWVAKKIKQVIPDYEDCDKYGFELQEIIENFEEGICTLEQANDINEDNYNYYLKQLADGEEDTYFEIKPIEEFDNYMDDLYNFADKERIWVKTNF